MVLPVQYYVRTHILKQQQIIVRSTIYKQQVSIAIQLVHYFR